MYASLENVWRPWRDFFQGSPKSADAESKRPVQKTESPTTSPTSAEPAERKTKPKAHSDPRVELERRSYKSGFRFSTKSGELEANRETEQSLIQKATGDALTIVRSSSEANEDRKAQKYKALQATLKVRSDARDRAKAVHHQASRSLAALGPAKPRPEIPALLRHATTVGLTISIAPTFHDLAVGLDPFFKWLVAVVSAWGLGLLIVHGLLPTGADLVRAARRHNSAFYAGLGIGAGLFGIRIVSATTMGDVIFAVALTVTEFSVVWLWERKTSDLGRQIAEWEKGEAPRDRLRGIKQAAADNLADRQRAYEETNAQIEALDREYEYELVLSDKKTLVTIATNAILAGYRAGISANVGAVNGAASLEDESDEEEEEETESE